MLHRGRHHVCFWSGRAIPTTNSVGGHKEPDGTNGKSTSSWLALRLQCILCLDCLTRVYFKGSKRYRCAFGIAALETIEIKQPSTLPPSPGGCFWCGSKNNRYHHNGALAAVSHQARHTDTTHKLICHLQSQGGTSRIHSLSNRPIRPVQTNSRLLWSEQSHATSKSSCAGPAGTSIQSAVTGSQAVCDNWYC